MVIVSVSFVVLVVGQVLVAYSLRIHRVFWISSLQAALPVRDSGVLRWFEILVVNLPVVLVEQRRLMVLVNIEIRALLHNLFVKWLSPWIDLRSFRIHPRLVGASFEIVVIVAKEEQGTLRLVFIVHICQMILVHEVVEFGQLLLGIYWIMRCNLFKLFVICHVLAEQPRNGFGVFLPQHLLVISVLDTLRWHFLLPIILREVYVMKHLLPDLVVVQRFHLELFSFVLAEFDSLVIINTLLELSANLRFI